MKLDEVTAIHQTTDPKEVNMYLAKGYRIIKMISSKQTVGLEEIVQPCYVLGISKT